MRRVDDIYEAVVAGLPEREIRRYVSKSCDWVVDDRTLERYIATARKSIHAKSEFVREQKIGEAIAFLESQRARAVAGKDYRTALMAQRDLCRLLGLDAPTRTQVSGDEGGPLEVIFKHVGPNEWKGT